MLAITDLQNVSDQVDQAVSDSLSLNRTDARCLSALIIRGPMAAGELAAVAGLAPSALTFAINRLVRAGYVERVRDPADGRRVLVEATEAARRFASDVWHDTVTATERRLSGYSKAQLAFLGDFLRDQVTLQQRLADRIRGWSVS